MSAKNVDLPTKKTAGQRNARNGVKRTRVATSR